MRGVTRIVIPISKVVLKIPNFSYSWKNFLRGLLANLQEKETYSWHPHKNLLAPVIWCSWGGWLLIMRRATVVEEDQDYQKWIEAGLGGDDKWPNYGYIDGNLVKIDYGS